MSRKEIFVLSGLAQAQDLGFRYPFLSLKCNAQGEPLYQVGEGDTDPAYTIADLQIEIADGAKITIFEPPLCFDFPDEVPEDFIVLVVGHGFEESWAFPYAILPPNSVRVERDGVAYIGGSLASFLAHYKSVVTLCLEQINKELETDACELQADVLSAHLALLYRMAIHDADLCDKVLILRCALLIHLGREVESLRLNTLSKWQGTKNPGMIQSQTWRVVMSGKLGNLK